MNKVWLLGRIGQAPEIRSLTKGGRVASFTLATNEGYKDRESGQWVEQTQWHRVVTFQDSLIDIIEKHCGKGRLVSVAGRLAYRQYRREGEDTERTAAEIVLDLRGEIDFPTPPPT